MEDAKSLEAIARQYGIVLMLEFGSAVSGREHARSDRDIAVLLDRPALPFQEHAALAHDLQTPFPGREVDLAVINRADPLFLKQIPERCRLLFGAPRRLHALRMYAFRRYQDHRRYLRLERAYVDRALGPRGAS